MNNDMTDLSFTQTSRAMTSRHINRAGNTSRPIWIIAADSNKNEKKYIDRQRDGKRSNPTVFMGC